MFKNLLKPLKSGNLKLKNRIVLSPMGIGSYNRDETITEDYIDFVKARSAETGLVITTGTRVTRKYGKFKVNGCYDDRFITGLSRLAESARKNGAVILLQIIALGPADPLEPYVPSLNIDEYRDLSGFEKKPEELRLDQIQELIYEFISAARRAQQAGFNGVELFGSEDGLISSFICPHFNKRDDAFGGNFENRLRFPVEIIRGIKKECGEDFIAGFKFNAIHSIDEGIDFKLGKRIAKKMSDENADYIHCWSFETFEKQMSTYKYSPMPNLYQPRNSLIEISRNIKKAIPETPVLVVGGILKHDEADEIIGNGFADLVAVGRGFIADDSWGYKAKNVRRSSPLRPCIRCHICHNEVAIKGKLVACSVNPDVLATYKPDKSEKSLDIMVIGGGPAGITAAVTAANRGHRVRLYEKEETIGGKLVPGSAPDFKHEFRDLLEYKRLELANSTVKVKTGIEVDSDFVIRKNPDVLILAIGANTRHPRIKGSNTSNVCDAVFALNNPGCFRNRNVIIIGGGDVGCETALFLIGEGARRVSIIEMLDQVMQEEIEHNRVTLLGMIKDAGIEVYTESRVIEISAKSIKFLKKEEIISNYRADDVVIATGFIVPKKEISSFKKTGIKMLPVGDCIRPRRLREAIGTGFETGKAI
jgi:2,4-dienoyl-CoA reductase-like NADH-dependent reductase (Old Yellow Enzyme family)/thioredoxin reductase